MNMQQIVNSAKDKEACSNPEKAFLFVLIALGKKKL